MGEPFIITRPEEAAQKATRFRGLIQSPVLTDIKIDFGKFQVYDLEPLSVPDVLADRPVLVFGKWRAHPQGHVVLQGIGGDGPFTTKIDVSGAAPSDANAALRFLWARHRIAILSDYNNLFPDDEHLTEVTDLGLTYNLLTAYTSFVAVDTQVRLRDGQWVTVKQPLPLPQGVSDLAVGGRTLLQKSSPGIAPIPYVPLASGNGRAVMEQSLEVKKQDNESEPKQRPLKAACIRLDKVFVSEGLKKELVELFLKEYIQTIEPCCRRLAGVKPPAAGHISLTLTIDSTGRVTQVKVVKKTAAMPSFEQCVTEAFELLSFPAAGDDKQRVIRLTLVVEQ
jgi:Ca-activated chloride channel family protein